MDFIIKLLKSENISIGIKYNSILIVVEKLVKCTKLGVCNKGFITK